MSGSNHYFLTCIQVSQETGKVVCYPHLFKNFPHFVVIYTVKGFSIVNEAEGDVFLELSCFLYDPMDVGNLISCSSALSKPSLYIWKFLAHLLLKPSLKDFEHYLASMWNESIVWQFEHSFALPFFGIGMKTHLFQSYGHCWVFQICWHNESSTLIASSIRILSSSARISTPLLSLFIVMLPKVHLTSHTRMSGFR